MTARPPFMLDYALPPEPDPVDELATEVAQLRGVTLRLAWIVALLLVMYLPLCAALLWAVA